MRKLRPRDRKASCLRSHSQSVLELELELYGYLSEAPGSLPDLMSKEAKPWKSSMVSAATSSLSKAKLVAGSLWQFSEAATYMNAFGPQQPYELGVLIPIFVDEEMEAH